MQLNQLTPQDLLDDPATPFWVKDVIRTALEKDFLEASNCFYVLNIAFKNRVWTDLKVSHAKQKEEKKS